MATNSPDLQRRAELFQETFEDEGIRVDPTQAMSYALQSRENLLTAVRASHPRISADGLERIGDIHIETERRSSFLGKAAKFALLLGGGLGAAYLAATIIKRGATNAFRAGDIVQDRMTVGAAHLTPPMTLPPAPPSLQPLPSGDMLEGF